MEDGILRAKYFGHVQNLVPGAKAFNFRELLSLIG